jgi:hypothetical protein
VSTRGGRSPGRYVPSIVLVLVTIAYIAIALRYRPEARAMPLLAGSIAAVLLALDLISLTSSRIGTLLTEWLSPERDAPMPAFSRMRQAQAIAWVLGFTALLFLAGVLSAVLLYVVGSMRFFGRRSWLSAIITAVLVAGFIWTLFSYALSIPLYSGWVADYLAARGERL